MKPGSGTLVIDISGEKAEAYEGTYQCTAHNEHGTAVSNDIVIRQSSKTLFLLYLIYIISNSVCKSKMTSNVLSCSYNIILFHTSNTVK